MDEANEDEFEESDDPGDGYDDEWLIKRFFIVLLKYELNIYIYIYIALSLIFIILLKYELNGKKNKTFK